MIEVKENPKKGSGFDAVHQFESWKIAFITSAAQYGELKEMKRHMLSDEAFANPENVPSLKKHAVEFYERLKNVTLN